MTHVYDKAKWHYDGDYPKELSIDQAIVHTGMYLGWIIDNRLYSTKFEKEAAADILNFKERKLTGTQVYINWAGILANDMLNEEGNEFSETYYEEEYGEVINAGLPTLYHVQDTWENYELIKNRIDETYIKVKGLWMYLYHAVDSERHTIDFYLSELRDKKATKRFFVRF